MTLETVPGILQPQVILLSLNFFTQALVKLLINLANQRALLGIINMSYDRPSEMVPEQFFLARMLLLFTITRQ